MPEENTNIHGQWIDRRDTPKWRDYLEKAIGKKLPDNDSRLTRKSGQPEVGPTCTYCGSVHPDKFLEAIRAGHSMEIADWKYGWPHKVYIMWPNPSPGEKRLMGSTSEGAKLERDTDGDAVRWVKTQDDAPEGFPIWSDSQGWSYEGEYRLLQIKFYNEHLAEIDLDELTRELIYDKIGVDFSKDEDGRVKWRTAPPSTP